MHNAVVMISFSRNCFPSVASGSQTSGQEPVTRNFDATRSSETNRLTVLCMDWRLQRASSAIGINLRHLLRAARLARKRKKWHFSPIRACVRRESSIDLCQSGLLVFRLCENRVVIGFISLFWGHPADFLVCRVFFWPHYKRNVANLTNKLAKNTNFYT